MFTSRAPTRLTNCWSWSLLELERHGSCRRGRLGNMDDVKISGTDDVTITLDRPQAINSLSGEMLGTIGEVVKRSPRSIDLSGAGERGYCSGADIRELRALVLKDPEAAGDWLDGEYDVDAVSYTHLTLPTILLV